MYLYHSESRRKISAAGAAELLHSEMSINALEYKRILHNGLLPSIEKLSQEERSDVFFFQ